MNPSSEAYIHNINEKIESLKASAQRDAKKIEPISHYAIDPNLLIAICDLALSAKRQEGKK